MNAYQFGRKLAAATMVKAAVPVEFLLANPSYFSRLGRDILYPDEEIMGTISPTIKAQLKSVRKAVWPTLRADPSAAEAAETIGKQSLRGFDPAAARAVRASGRMLRGEQHFQRAVAGGAADVGTRRRAVQATQQDVARRAMGPAALRRRLAAYKAQRAATTAVPAGPQAASRVTGPSRAVIQHRMRQARTAARSSQAARPAAHASAVADDLVGPLLQQLKAKLPALPDPDDFIRTVRTAVSGAPPSKNVVQKALSPTIIKRLLQRARGLPGWAQALGVTLGATSTAYGADRLLKYRAAQREERARREALIRAQQSAGGFPWL